MTNEAKPVSATLSDFKLVKTRKVAQFVFEVPLEQADEALRALGGLPQAHSERWCAIVLLDLSKASPTAPETPTEPIKERRRFNTLPLPQQAALLCADPKFWRFLSERCNGDVASEDDAADWIRNDCEIASRGDLSTNERAAAIFRILVREFDVWKMVPA